MEFSPGDTVWAVVGFPGKPFGPYRIHLIIYGGPSTEDTVFCADGHAFPASVVFDHEPKQVVIFLDHGSYMAWE